MTIAADDETPSRYYRAEIAVTDSRQEDVAPSWNPQENRALEDRAAVPVIVQVPGMTERWIAIRDGAGRFVTVIEIISRTKRSGYGLADYSAKRRTLLSSSINLVEIDLLPGGQAILPDSFVTLPYPAETHYIILLCYS